MRDGRPLLGGFGPLVVAVVLAVLMVLLVPSVAPERVVTRPAPAEAAP
jgi:competence protein ComGC